ncbi:MAG: hypothetical protein ABIP75_18910 [Pyrinomonadaceae bacterium]
MKPQEKSWRPGNPPRVVLIEALRELARKLGHTPTRAKWQEHYAAMNFRSVRHYDRRFGGWKNALKAAGLPLNQAQEYTKDELIDQLRNLSKKLRRPISTDDVNAASRAFTCANKRAFCLKFGSVSKALAAAGVRKVRRISDKSMLDGLKTLAARIDRPLRGSDVKAGCRKGLCAGLSSYAKRFGGFPQAMAAAGLEYLPPKYHREELIYFLRKLHDELGRRPTFRDITAKSIQGEMPSRDPYLSEFGSLAAALAAAGCDQANSTIAEIKEDLAAQLRELTAKLGYAPSVAEWTSGFHDGLIAGPQRYVKVFGSLTEARQFAGVLGQLKARDRTKHFRKNHATRQEMIDLVRKLAAELGRKPRTKDIDKAHRAGSRVTYAAIENHFGGIEGICRAAGLEALPGGLSKCTREEMTEHLREFCQKVDHIPRGPEWDAQRDRAKTVGLVVYVRRFGSWGAALQAAGQPAPGSVVYRSATTAS